MHAVPLTYQEYRSAIKALCNSHVPIMIQTYQLAPAMALDYFMSDLEQSFGNLRLTYLYCRLWWDLTGS